MALDATVGGNSANSYVSQDEANDYFADTLQADDWTAVTAKDGALVQATEYLNSLEWRGNKASSTQALQLPRKSLYDVNGSLVPSDSIPPEVKRATYQLALFLAANSDGLTPDLTTKIKVDVIEIEQEVLAFGSFSALPTLVKNLIKPFMKTGSGVVLELQ